MSLITPFFIGLFSGFHCVVMCGSLCQVICHKKKLTSVVLTNLGRVSTYVILGVIFAGIVQGASLTLNLTVIGLWLRIMMGITMILMGIVIILQRKNAFLAFNKALPLWPTASQKLKQLNDQHYFIKGMLWGLIPCGLLYGLLLIAATTADALRGGFFMLFFGFGTLAPLLISHQLFNQLQNVRFFKWVRHFSGIFIILVGLWIIAGPWIAHHFIPQDSIFFTQLAAVMDLCMPDKVF